MFRNLLALIFIFFTVSSYAQETNNDLSIDDQRAAALKKFDATDVPDLEAVRDFAKSVFSVPVESQSVEDLKKLAREANKTANLIDYLFDEYKSYHSSNYRYEFVQEKVAPAMNSYGEYFNEFVNIRNEAYFNLGIISKSKGDAMEAFLFFKDAFRLSSFDCGPGKPAKDCMR